MNPDMKVVYPAPPPTTNELTSHQRAQLVRKARKIEQILGATPQLVDATIRSTNPIHVALPYHVFSNTQRRLTKVRRSSVDSTSSSSSTGSLPTISRSSSISSTHNSHRPVSSRKNSFEIWPRTDFTPKLRLTTQSPCLETIPASPPADISSSSDDDSFISSSSSPSPSHSRSNSRAGYNLDAYALVATETSPRDSLVLTPLIIPSANSFRKQKMDRLRKKLGADVPFDLVFPKENESDCSENYPPSLTADLVEKRPRTTSTPTPVSHQRKSAKKSSGRIASSRDSLVLDIHRAKRQVHVATSPSSPLAYRDKALLAVPNADFKKLTGRLSLIIESPDEHGAGCAEEFGIVTSANLKVTDISSQWLISSSNKTELKLWSTRRGYEGWNSERDVSKQINPDASPISSFTVLSSCDDDDSVSSAGPVTPDSPLTPVSSTFLNRSPSGIKKRPSSYRKPAPPIPTECC